MNMKNVIVLAAVFLAGAGASGLHSAFALTPLGTRLPPLPPHTILKPVSVASLPVNAATPAAGTPWKFTCPASAPFDASMPIPLDSAGHALSPSDPATPGKRVWSLTPMTGAFIGAVYNAQAMEFSCGYAGVPTTGVQPNASPWLAVWFYEYIDPRAKNCAMSADWTTLNCTW